MHSLKSTGLISPVLVKTLKRNRHIEGVVEEDGVVQIEGFDQALVLENRDAITPGTEVYVKLRNGNFVCESKIEKRKREQEREKEREKEKQEKREKKNKEAEKAKEFWEKYNIPFEHDVAIKGRRSELLRGSSGTGVTNRTVIHLFVLESFKEGRLEREENEYLCDDTAKIRFTDSPRKVDGEGREFMPKVTCKTCRNLMERWKK